MASALITVPELAAQIRATPQAIYSMRAKGQGPRATKVGKALLFRQADVDAWLDSRREPDRHGISATA